MRNNQPPPLKITMYTRGGIHVDLLTLPKGVCLLDSEAKLLQAMEDLLPLAASFKGFQDNTRWSIKSSVSHVFHVLWVNLLKKLKSEYVKIVLQDGVYRVMIKQPIYFDVTCPAMPVYFLLVLEKADRRLFELSFYLVILLHRHSNIQYWDEDNDGYIFENIEESLANYKQNQGSHDYTKEIEAYERAHKEYGDKGAATSFKKRLEKTGASKKLWLEALEEYQPKTSIGEDFYRWLQLGKELVTAGLSMNKFISLPPELEQDAEQYEQIPATPDQRVKFVWRTDDCWFEVFEGYAQSEDQNEGSLPFYINKVIERYSDIAAIEDSFPAKLLRFMKAGRDLEEKYRVEFSNSELLTKALRPKQKKLIDIL